MACRQHFSLSKSSYINSQQMFKNCCRFQTGKSNRKLVSLAIIIGRRLSVQHVDANDWLAWILAVPYKSTTMIIIAWTINQDNKAVPSRLAVGPEKMELIKLRFNIFRRWWNEQVSNYSLLRSCFHLSRDVKIINFGILREKNVLKSLAKVIKVIARS